MLFLLDIWYVFTAAVAKFSPDSWMILLFILQGDKSSARSEACRGDPAIFSQAYRKHSAHLSNILPDIWYSWCTGKQ